MHFSWDLVAPPVTTLSWPVPVDRTGRLGPTPGQARGRSWRRTSHNRYVAASIRGEVVEQRVLEQYCGVGGQAVVTAWAALRLHGAAYFDGLAHDGTSPMPVPIACNGARVAARPGLLAVRLTVPPDETEELRGIRCARVERALYDEMRRRRTRTGMVIAADMTFAAGLTSILRMGGYCDERRWYRDVRRVAEALTLCDEHARSGPEVAFRLIWQLDAGWGQPLCNRPVLDLEGRLVAVPDLIDVERGVVGEYAGSHHRDIERHARDINREAALRDVGLEYVEVVGRNLTSPAEVVRRLHDAARRSAASTLPRRWLLAPPPDPTLDQLLDRRPPSSDIPAS